MGAICPYCEGDMLVVDGCDHQKIEMKDGKVYKRVKYGEDGWGNIEHCHDCGAKWGNYHHRGRVNERYCI